MALSNCATAPRASVDAESTAVLEAMCQKLAAAQTIRVRATRTASPGFQAGTPVAESASGTIVVSRPSRMVARMQTSEGARTVAFDGSQLTVVDYAAKTHASVKAVGDIDTALRGVENVYGVTPPVAVLLANDPKAILLSGVKTGRAAGTEAIRGEACDRLEFTQDGFSWTLWVSAKDSLPRRMALSYPNRKGGKPLTMTAEMLKWELGAPVSPAELTASIPAGSRAVEMIPLQP